MIHFPHNRKRALTLLEVVLSMGLLVTLSSMTYWFYASVLTTRDDSTGEAQKLRIVRAVLDRMGREIRQTTVMTIDGEVGLRGETEHIYLSSLRMPDPEIAREPIVGEDQSNVGPTEYDVVKVEYMIARHPEVVHADGWELPLGLARMERLIPRPIAPQQAEGDESGASQEGSGSKQSEDLDAFGAGLEDLFAEAGLETDPNISADMQWEQLYAPEIRSLRFCYFDGRQWWDDWVVFGENPLPQLVMVTVGFEDRPSVEDVSARSKEDEEFCTCLNRDPPDCQPLAPDMFQSIIRVTHADPLFRSRLTRETQHLVEQAAPGEGEEQEEGQ